MTELRNNPPKDLAGSPVVKQKLTALWNRLRAGSARVSTGREVR